MTNMKSHMTESDYIEALRRQWSRDGEASAGALQLADEAAANWPNSPRILCLRAALIQLAPENSPYTLEDALACYQRALAADPHAVPTLEEIGYYFDAVVGDSATAQHYFDAIREREAQGIPSDPARVSISRDQLTEWAGSLLHMNHHGTLIARALESGNVMRAKDLAERARRRAWRMFNELVALGAEKPEGYCEPGTGPTSMSEHEDGTT
jgi:tetratricopeptide (TPR) repeat protein